MSPGLMKEEMIKYRADVSKLTVTGANASYRAERELTLANFKQLLALFQQYSNPTNGRLGLADFKMAFAAVLGEGLTDDQLELMFLKIDVDNNGGITWDEFSTHMLLQAEGETAMLEGAQNQLFESRCKSTSRHPIHKEMIVRIQYISSTRKIMTCCREGTISFWNESLKVQRHYRNAGYSNLTSQLCSEPGRKQDGFTFEGTDYRWINDAIYIENIHKIVMASDDHQITFYEGSTLERCLCFDLQNVNALSLHYFKGMNSSSTLLYSTDSGHICMFTFDEDQLAKLAIRQKGRVDHFLIEKEGVTKFKNLGCISKRKAHADWALKVRFFAELRLIISCSPDPKESLSVAEMDSNQKWRYSSVSVQKGVTSFAYSKNPILIATGGVDRELRLWNPHKLSSPTATLSGHTAPIIDLTVNEIHGQLVSLSSDKVVKIWDCRKHTCMQSINNTQRQYPDDNLSAVFFVGELGGCILTSSSVLYQYPFKNRMVTHNHPKSHNFPVRCILYNSKFKQIVSGCDGGEIIVWDLTNGQKCFRFLASESGSEITAIVFDHEGKRLFTGTRGNGND